MKIIRIIIISLFSLILLVPMVTFNFEENSVSDIDNRMLAEFPLSDDVFGKTDFTKSIENYINDRIGFRDEMITAQTIINDVLFDKMVHPSYSYGTNGYVFGNGLTSIKTKFSDHHKAFANMIKSVQDYCLERNVPFVFVFNPAKPAVYNEYLPVGFNYSRAWVDELFVELDSLGVRYVDNTKTLIDKKLDGVQVFNQKYDANHWNYIGAYHGTNAILKEIKKDFPSVYVNSDNDVSFSQKLQKTLLVSKFPINEYVPTATVNSSAIDITTQYKDEVEMHSSFRNFGYYENAERAEEGAPKALVFQGSYMNSYGTKFFANSFAEYVHVHDYQNVINLPYYFNLFNPECVVFEVAEYTISNYYFDQKKMTNINYNAPLTSLTDIVWTEKSLAEETITAEQGNEFAKITWTTQEKFDHAWLVLEKEYDLLPTQNGYYATVPVEDYTTNLSSMKIYTTSTENSLYK